VTPTCYLHIGGYKTGTTYLQRRLIDGRAALRASGVLMPGTKGIGEHVRAGKVIMGRPDLRGQPIPAQAWYGLRDEMLVFEGHSAVYSYEELCAATREQARRMVDDLAPADVRIVITVRDLVRVIPAAWQEIMQGGQQWTWEQYVATITSRAGRAVPPGRTFWRNNDVVAVAKRWADAVGPDALTVVTVPPTGAPSDLLWNRFCAAIGADPTVVAPDLGSANESLDIASAELLRRFNVKTADSLPTHVYDREVKWFVAKDVLAGRSGPDRVQLDGAKVAWARREGQRTADGLRELGVRVEGDLAELVGSPAEPAPPAAPTSEEMLDAAIDVIAALVARLGDREAQEADRARRRRGQPAAGGPVAIAGSEPAVPPPAKVTARARKLAGRLLRESYDRTHR
jgi:hypothetical protein